MAKLQPPPATGNDGFDRWLRLFVAAALVPTDIRVDNSRSARETAVTETTDHTLLQNLNSDSYTHLTASQVQGLTRNASTVLHFHNADRDRTNHTGTQTSDTISDFASAVQANSTNNAGFFLAFAAANG
jgi:hypothetical protein